MAANGIVTVLKDMREQIEGLEIALTQPEAACLAQGMAGEPDLAAAHTAALHIAAKLAKAASEVLFLCGPIDNARKELNASVHYCGKKLLAN